MLIVDTLPIQINVRNFRQVEIIKEYNFTFTRKIIYKTPEEVFNNYNELI